MSADKSTAVSSLKKSVKNYQNPNEFDIRKSVSIFLILIIYAEWLPCFMEYVMNFMIEDFRDVTVTDWILMTPFVSNIFILFLISALAWKISKYLTVTSKYVIPIIIIATSIVCWLFYLGYYQINGYGATALPGIVDASNILGFHVDYSSFTRNTFLISNGMIFFLLVPALFTYATKGKGFLIFDRSFEAGLLFGGLYLFFRYGSIIGSAYRLAIICIISAGIWIMPINEIIREKMEKHHSQNQIDDKSNQSSIKSLDMIPLFAGSGVILVISFWFGAIGWFMNGLLYNTWIWIFLPVGIILKWVCDWQNIQIKNKVLDYLVYLILIGIGLLLILSHIKPDLMYIENVLLCIGMVIIGFQLFSNDLIFQKSKKSIFMNNPFRLIAMAFFGVIGNILPFIAAASEPLTITVSLGLYGAFALISFIVVVINDLKKKR